MKKATTQFSQSKSAKQKKRSKKYFRYRREQVLASYNQLLRDVSEVFETLKKKNLSSGEIIHALAADKSKPWFKYRDGKPISRSILDRILLRCGIVKRRFEKQDHYTDLYHAKSFTQYRQPTTACQSPAVG